MAQDNYKSRQKEYIYKLIKSTCYHLNGNEDKLSDIPHYLVHMLTYKNTYEHVIKYIVENHELSDSSFEKLVRKYIPADKQIKYISEYQDKDKKVAFAFSDFKLIEYPFLKGNERIKQTALEDLEQYCSDLTDFIENTSIEETIFNIPFINYEQTDEGIYYLFEDNDEALNLEAALLGVHIEDADTVDSFDTLDKKDKKKKLNKNRIFSAYKELFDNDINSVREQTYTETENYFSSLYNFIERIFPDEYITNLFQPLFTALLKLEFSYNLKTSLLSAQNKHKELYNEVIDDRDIAELINISGSQLSGYKGKNSFPDVEGLYKLADVIATSCDTLLGNISQNSIDDEYIYNRYGLGSDTLRHLEQLKSIKDTNGTDTTAYLNGLNKCLQSISYSYYAEDKNKIDITKEEYQAIQDLYLKGLNIKANAEIKVKGSKGLFHKTSEDIDVLYSNTDTIIKTSDIEIEKKPLTTQYKINDKTITHRHSDDFMTILYKGLRNTISYREYLTCMHNDFEGHLPVQTHVIGNVETDFFSSLCKYLNNENSLFCTINQKDMDYFLDECGKLPEQIDSYSLESFLQDIYSNYGYEKHESDSLKILQITEKLRKYKDSLYNQ